MSRGIWNLPNRLTVGRLVLAAGFVAAMTGPWRYGHTAGFILFVLASVTDLVDGYLARRLGLVTDFGKLMDPLADKVLMAAAFICLIPSQAIPAWAVVAIISREFLITGLRLLALTKGKILPAEAMGKHKTAWQVATVVFLLALLVAAEIFPKLDQADWWQTAWRWIGGVLVTFAVVLTLISGAGYFWKHRDLVTED